MFSPVVPTLLLALMSTSQPAEAPGRSSIDPRPRTIVTTDGEIDDRSSPRTVKSTTAAR